MTVQTTEDRTAPLRDVEDRPGPFKAAAGFKVAANKKQYKLSGHKLIGVERKRPKSLFPSGPPAMEIETVAFAYKSFAFVAVDTPVRGRPAKKFYREEAGLLKELARAAADRCKVSFADLVEFIREHVPELSEVFAAVDIRAEAAEAVQAAKLERAEEEEIARSIARSEARQAAKNKKGKGPEMVKAAEKHRLETERMEAERAAKMAAIDARALKMTREREEARREAADVKEAMADLEAKRAAAHARRAAKGPESPAPAPEALERIVVPESAEVRREGLKRSERFAGLVGFSPRRRKAEAYLAALRAK